nr:hypothetical protein [Bartonella washoeensis]
MKALSERIAGVVLGGGFCWGENGQETCVVRGFSSSGCDAR